MAWLLERYRRIDGGRFDSNGYWRRIYDVVYWARDPEGDHGVALATLQIYFIDYIGYI